MEIKDERIDGGKGFDWGRTSSDYAKYRDIYPQEFYDKILERKLCRDGQRVLDLGTGTGVLPRNLYRYGALWTGADIAENQIREARRLSEQQKMEITYLVAPTEELHFPEATFDVITACQCFWYFDHERIAPELARMLKKDGRLLILYMAWLPYEDRIAGASEELVKKYSPDWSGAGETEHPIEIPAAIEEDFELVSHEEYRLWVPFTRESWNGRMKACRGVGASLSEEQIREWEREHRTLLEEIAPEQFAVLHYGALAELRPREKCRKESGIVLRRYQSADCPALAQLFYDTVHTVNRKDYTEEQVNAWATGTVDQETWDRSFQRNLTYVALCGGQIIGFGDMDETGYLDHLYIHKDYQRRGAAALLCSRMERETAARRFTTHASITARPFFEKRGYTVVKEQQVERYGVWMTNYVMEKKTE